MPNNSRKRFLTTLNSLNLSAVSPSAPGAQRGGRPQEVQDLFRQAWPSAENGEASFAPFLKVSKIRIHVKYISFTMEKSVKQISLKIDSVTVCFMFLHLFSNVEKSAIFTTSVSETQKGFENYKSHNYGSKTFKHQSWHWRLSSKKKKKTSAHCLLRLNMLNERPIHLWIIFFNIKEITIYSLYQQKYTVLNPWICLRHLEKSPWNKSRNLHVRCRLFPSRPHSRLPWLLHPPRPTCAATSVQRPGRETCPLGHVG